MRGLQPPHQVRSPAEVSEGWGRRSGHRPLRQGADGLFIRTLSPVQGLDSRKDQSYFLARLTQTQLARACFPLGALTKTAVKEIAAREGLNPTNAEESQDVCFIKAGSYRQLVASLTGRTPAPGLIETTAGKVVEGTRVCMLSRSASAAASIARQPNPIMSCA